MDTVAQFREVTGELRSVKRSLLAAEAEGLVIELNVEEGQTVKRGQVIARLDDTIATLELAREEATAAARRAAVREGKSRLEKAQRDLDRTRELAERAGASRSEVDDALTQYRLMEALVAQGEASVGAAEAQAGLARRRVAQMQIVAPFDGRVTRKATEVGQWVGVGDPLAEVVALDPIEARLDVPEALVDAIKEGSSRIRVRVRATGVERDAVVTHVVPEADALSRLFPVRVVMENPEGSLKPGMAAVGLVETGALAPTLTIPKDAILRDDAGEYVFFSAGGVAAPARVRSLFAVGERVAIAPGPIQPGMQVVVEGNERLFPGQPLAGGPPGAAPGGGPPGGPPTKDASEGAGAAPADGSAAGDR